MWWWCVAVFILVLAAGLRPLPLRLCARPPPACRRGAGVCAVVVGHCPVVGGSCLAVTLVLPALLAGGSKNREECEGSRKWTAALDPIFLPTPVAGLD